MAPSNSVKEITIKRLGQALADTATNNYLIGQIPIKGSSTQFYTVEARRFAGYDKHVNGRIPGEGILIHKVDTPLSYRNAKVMDSTTVDKNPDDVGAMRLPGKTFTDKFNGITVRIIGQYIPSGSSTPSGYSMQIQRTR